MASAVVTQFRLETTQYESKLRDATQGLREMMRSVSAAGAGACGTGALSPAGK